MVLRFFEAFERTKRRKKLLIKTSLIQFQRVHLLPIGLKFHEISIGMADENLNEFKLEIFNIEKSTCFDDEYIRKVIFIKDKHNISDLTYLKLQTNLNLELPTLHMYIKKEIDKYNKLFDIMVNDKVLY